MSITLEDITIRTKLQPGDLGYIVHRHGKLYAKEYGYGIAFESYVAAGIHEFYQAYDPARDCVWICEHHENIVGFLLLMHRSASIAQLRFFYLEPPYRGIGLGKKLMTLYMEFLTLCGYTSTYLWTTHEQTSAASLYQRYGFILMEEKDSSAFGKPLREQRYEYTAPIR
jgi:ribosomal protein S18 acetylase RimI-like enzyme